jgi:glycosyltransferase involved in cell wall biosynthesis
MAGDARAVPSISVVVRCHNEERHIGKLLAALARQTLPPAEVVVVDSGSTDGTLDIVARHPVRLVRIAPEEFTFGRSLNLGCASATGEILVFASAHVVPVRDDWLERLTAPFAAPDVALVYGRQVGNEVTRFSEHQLFAQQFPPVSNPDQRSPFCNNANAAVRRALWEEHHFDEALTGLEDLDWGKWALGAGHRIVYEADAAIVHIHEESPRKIFRRYEREAIALRRIFPDSHLTTLEMLLFIVHGIGVDVMAALRAGGSMRALPGVVMFRVMQYWGTFVGMHYRSPVTHELMMRFYYPAQRRAGEG